MWVFVLFHVFYWQNSHLDISFYLPEVQSLNKVEKLETTQFHEDLMLISLDNGYGTLTTIVVNKEGHGQSCAPSLFRNILSFSVGISITIVVDITMTVVSLIKETIFRHLIKVTIFRDLIRIFIYSMPN